MRLKHNLIILALFCAIVPSSGQTVVQIGLLPFTSRVALTRDAGDFHQALSDWSANQSYSEHFKLSPYDSSSKTHFQRIIKGRFDTLGGREVLILEILDSLRENPIVLKSELYSKDKDVLLDLAYLKIKTFLQTAIFGTLEITTKPVEAKVWINGLMSGSTPLELVLSKDRYNLRIGKSEFEQLEDTVLIQPGNRISREYQLKYKGLNPRPFLYSGVAITAFAVLAKYFEAKRHDEYKNLGPYLPDQVYKDKFSAYKNMNTISVTLIDAATICYGISAFCIIKNRVMAKKYLNE